jgi:hypothetical protein
MAQERHFVTTDAGRSRVIVIQKPPRALLVIVLVVFGVLFALSSVLFRSTSGFGGSEGALYFFLLLVGLIFSALTYNVVRISVPDEIEFRPIGSDKGQVLEKTEVAKFALVHIAVFLVGLIWVILL